LTLILVLLVASVAGAQGGGTTVAGGFNAPQGVLVAPDGSVWVIDSGIGGDEEVPAMNPETGEETVAKVGDSARVVIVASDGSQTVAASLPSILVGQEATGGARLALLDGTVYATSGIWLGAVSDEAAPNTAAVVKIEDGAASEVAQLWMLEKEQNPDPNILDSHPYGITAGPDGNLWVADAGGNTLLKVDPSSGTADLVTVFAGLPGPFPNPNRGGAMEADPVPTAVAFDGDGNMYVSLLPGFPFLPGSAKVVKVTADGQVSDYATGLTMVTDLRSGPDGQLYAIQMGQFTEQGPVPNSGAIVRVKEGDASEVVVAELSFPTSIDFNADGDAYVTTNGVGAPGSGELVLFEGVTSMAGAAAPAGGAPEAVPETGATPLNSAWLLVVAGTGLAAIGLFLRRRSSAGRVIRD
jgi:sugar lactone lactonase YvrE